LLELFHTTPPVPTHVVEYPFGVTAQLSIGTVHSPDTKVDGVAVGRMYPDQLLEVYPGTVVSPVDVVDH
jgi:hypothetical protein